MGEHLHRIMSSPACRVDLDVDLVHCSVPVRAEGATTVFVNKYAWSCQGHVNHPHLKPCGEVCCMHVAPIAVGSSTVIIEGRGAGKVGDAVAGCTFVATGSHNVFVGP